MVAQLTTQHPRGASMSCEPMRRCGYRKIGGLYLVAGSIGRPCHRLPLALPVCPTCRSGFKFQRGIQQIDPFVVFGICEASPCPCGPLDCPICWPFDTSFYGLQWVGRTDYPTPADFIDEAARLGVSKRIPNVPKWFKVKETWILLAHNTPSLLVDPPSKAVFAAYQPERIEKPFERGSLSALDKELMARRGITPVYIHSSDGSHD